MRKGLGEGRGGGQGRQLLMSGRGRLQGRMRRWPQLVQKAKRGEEEGTMLHLTEVSGVEGEGGDMGLRILAAGESCPISSFGQQLSWKPLASAGLGREEAGRRP